MRYRLKKHYTWSPDLAYIVGLLTADGCLYKDGRHINLTSKDAELISSTQTILQLRIKPVPIKTSNYGGSAYHLQFSDVAPYDFLLDIGLTPAKSKTITELKVPDEYFADF